MKATAKKMTAIAAFAVVAVMTASFGVSGIMASAATSSPSAYGGRYYSDFSSQEECVKAGEQFNKQLASEGIVLLKNDGTLPLSTGSKVSVLGIAQDCMVETSGSITQSLKDAGFQVNPTLESRYLNDNASHSQFGNETALNNTEKQSLRLYNDVGIVVIARGTAGESLDRSMAIDEEEDEKYLGNDSGWEHEAHQNDGAGKEYKHELQLTDSEQDLIKLAEESCKKVVVLYSASYTFEMANLQKDPKVNAIAWIGRLGDGGVAAVGEILNGTINPSGRTVDEWTGDFTNDPTYVNSLAQTYKTEGGENAGYTGIDYDEDIYLGYRFYETYWKEAKDGNATPAIKGKEGTITADEWYDHNVVYPFGYGLSYTTFAFKLNSLTANNDDTIEDKGTIEGSKLASSMSEEGVASPAQISTLYANVTVTNTGDVAGKEVVQVYVTAPYTNGKTEKPYLVLAGFAKTDTLKPKQSEKVTVALNVQDFASYDYTDANGDGHKGYELDAGEYTVHVMESSAHTNIPTETSVVEEQESETETTTAANAAYDSMSFSITSTDSKAVALDLDDFSGNKVGNLFSEENGDFNSLGVDGSKMTLLSRAKFDETMPSKTASANAYTLTSEQIKALEKYENISAANDKETDDWYQESVPEDWKQGTGVVGDNGMYGTTLNDMAGVPLYVDGKMSSSWVTFMNQLTWTEIQSILNNGYHLTVAVPTIGKLQSLDDNGPNYTYKLTTWVGTPTVSASWNTELCEQYGMMVGNTALWQGMTGWYGPGMNTHRSQFAGRTPEYYSQDGLQAGCIAAAVVKGATETGINVYIKHFAVYEVYNLMGNGIANISEQAMREIYLRPFQMSMQEGGAHAAMSSFNRIGSVYAGENYNLITKLAREEWGWNGFIVTDIYAQLPTMTMDGLIRAGAEIPDGDYTDMTGKNLSGTWDPDANDGKGAVLVNGSESATQWYCARMAATRLLYNVANSASNKNGVTDQSVSTTLSLTQGQKVSDSVLPEKYTKSGAGYDIACSITSGSLPKGLSIENGILKGTALTEGTSSVNLTVQIDGWISMDLKLILNISPIVTMEKDISNISTGDSVDCDVLFDSKDIQYQSSYTMSVSSGSLPTGLKMSTKGRITGTATVPGTYNFTVAVKAVDSSTQVLTAAGEAMRSTLETMSGSTTVEGIISWLESTGKEILGNAIYLLFGNANETYYMDYAITVTGTEVDAPATEPEAPAEAATVASIAADKDGNILVTYTDGSTVTINMSQNTPGTSTGSGTEDTTTSSSISGVAIAGLVIGIVAVLGAGAAIAIIFLRKKNG